MKYLLIYLLQLVIVTKTMAIILSIVAAVSSIMLFIMMIIKLKTKMTELSYPTTCKGYAKQINQSFKPITKYLHKLNIACICLSLFLFLLPSEQTLILISSVYYNIISTKQIIANERTKVIDVCLDKIIKDLKGAKI